MSWMADHLIPRHPPPRLPLCAVRMVRTAGQTGQHCTPPPADFHHLPIGIQQNFVRRLVIAQANCRSHILLKSSPAHFSPRTGSKEREFSPDANVCMHPTYLMSFTMRRTLAESSPALRLPPLQPTCGVQSAGRLVIFVGRVRNANPGTSGLRGDVDSSLGIVIRLSRLDAYVSSHSSAPKVAALVFDSAVHRLQLCSCVTNGLGRASRQMKHRRNRSIEGGSLISSSLCCWALDI